MVATFQLVKSQRSVYLISRSSKAKIEGKRDSGYQDCCLLQAHRILAFSSGMSPDVCHCLGRTCQGFNRESVYISHVA